MFIYGVVNASPDSLELESIVASETDALDRSRGLIADGADGIDIGGQGSTDGAEVVDWETEWARVDTVINSVAKLGVEVSIDSWRPEVVERALQAGATVINAADGMQSDRMWEVASNFNVPIVVPFLPLYVALPWKETSDHDELLEIVLKSEPEYARAHFPGKVRQVEKRLKNI